MHEPNVEQNLQQSVNQFTLGFAGVGLSSPIIVWGSSAMTTRPDLAADRRIEGYGYTVRRPRRGPSDDEVRMLINIHQEGEIAFQLHRLAQLKFTVGSALLESRTYEA